MTYIPTTLAQAWTDALAGHASPRIVLGNFLDDWRRVSQPENRHRLIRDPIADTDDEELHRWGAFLAATVEYLTVRDGVPTPPWVFEDRWVLPEPWFLLSYWKMRAWQLAATPPPWKRRRIFGGDERMLIGRV
ncbi:hypothetical protein TPY_2640 [Sulfobacillus acidophilus TPY]|uniref:Uncharacterized protein n=1 Tax=Sulfobacillus acidophilus (strain ATCC 700253 / DSM 10332 / NAL) TaxID=679936 RepID=G8TVA0_SULAD|nr:hypothetical protein TPY_2640 [Sulfobacillus acidophilus TPY]AEW04740.1 hypothetical protein Sulac_1240 [Sulfobacillus acidophilus DSM 10332]